MRWLAVWLLLSAVLLAVLLSCRWLTGGLHLTRADAAGLLLIPLAQLAALAALAATAGRPRGDEMPDRALRRHPPRDSERAPDRHPAAASNQAADRGRGA